MGWSCSAKASGTFEAITEWMRGQDGDKSQNVWIDKGRKFMWETSRREYPDGDITGQVWEFYPEGHEWVGRVHKVGSLRIDGDGTIRRFPHLPPLCKMYVKYHKERRSQYYD